MYLICGAFNTNLNKCARCVHSGTVAEKTTEVYIHHANVRMHKRTHIHITPTHSHAKHIRASFKKAVKSNTMLKHT